MHFTLRNKRWIFFIFVTNMYQSKFLILSWWILLRHGKSLRWHHNEQDGVSNQQPHHCLLNRLFGCRSKKTPKLRVTGLCARNSPGTDEFSAQMASNTENVSIWWRHHVKRWVMITTRWICWLNCVDTLRTIAMNIVRSQCIAFVMNTN